MDVLDLVLAGRDSGSDVPDSDSDGRPWFGRPWFGYGFGRPFGFFGGPFAGGLVGGLVGSALLNPYLYGGYGYPYYPYYY